jgi:suppressor of ftsI
MKKKFFLTLLICVHLFSASAFAQDKHQHSRPATILSSKKSILQLPLVKKSKTIRVKDGDQITITATRVREKIQGQWVERLAYDGMIPGPSLLADQGSRIKLTLVNKIGQPTTLHSHGLRVDDRNDGIPGVGQPPIKDGESFTYDLSFPDHGLYWYHPHMREDMTQELGLYGTYLVTPKTLIEDKPKREELLVLDDILSTKEGLPAFDVKHTSFALMGRYGNQMLINNQRDWGLQATVGEVIRFYLVNVANARPFRVGFTNAKIKVVGADNGFYEQEFFTDSIILAPSERAIVDVIFKKPGTSIIENRPEGKAVTIGRIHIKKNPHKNKIADCSAWKTLKSQPTVTADFQQIKPLLDKPASFTLKIDAQLSGEHAEHMMTAAAPKDGIEWEDTMGAMSEDMTEENVKWLMTDPATNKVNMDIQWKFTQGIPVKVRIHNDGKHHPMQHPIHFHGQRFAVVNINGQLNKNLVWKDTVLVPAGQYVDIILDNLNPGQWMGHCHIAEHLNVGMMFGFSVEDVKEKSKS